MLGQHPRDVADSSPERSSASTWICTRKMLFEVGAHSTSIIRSGSCSSDCTLCAVRAVHRDAAAPRVTKPTIGSPGTGVQHFASLTRMSGAPRTSTPESLLRSWRARP